MGLHRNFASSTRITRFLISTYQSICNTFCSEDSISYFTRNNTKTCASYFNFMPKLSSWINKNHFVFTRCQCTENEQVHVDVICVNIGLRPSTKCYCARSTRLKRGHSYLMFFVPCASGIWSIRDISQSSEQKCKTWMKISALQNYSLRSEAYIH
jgi:hypothetical protein